MRVDGGTRTWRRRLGWGLAVLAAVGLIALVGGTVWQLVPIPEPTGPDGSRLTVELATAYRERVTATLTAMAGAGGLVGLAMVMRRQWNQESELRLAQRVAADARHDAEERRITELYMSAAEQLGHDRAPVRLAALYALDRLGQNHPGHRQVIVDIWCAYLRRPFAVPVDLDESGWGEFPAEFTEEYEVRATAFRLLAGHLLDDREPAARDEGAPPERADGYWRLRRVDLTGATLIDPDLTDRRFPALDLRRAAVHGRAEFRRARFDGEARFERARFLRGTQFHDAVFAGPVHFDDGEFGPETRFISVRFGGEVRCERARFADGCSFSGARFAGLLWARRSRFVGSAVFVGTRFGGETRFDDALFASAKTMFNNARFADIAGFAGAAFDNGGQFCGVSFAGPVHFLRTAELDLSGATVTLPESHIPNAWPQDWRPVAGPAERAALRRTGKPA